MANLLAADTVSPPAAAILKSKKIFKSLMDAVCGGGGGRGGKGGTLSCEESILILKAPRKNASENVVCLSRLLQIIAQHY